MIEEMLKRLATRDEDCRLDRLEQAIWEREHFIRTTSAASRRLASWQALVLSLAVLLSAVAGATAVKTISPPVTDWFGGASQSTPTMLLFGANR